MTNKFRNGKLIYILSQFPETHETFILREFEALKNRGVDFKILSLKLCRDKVIHDEAKELIGRTIYGRVCSLWSIVYGLRHPIRMIASFLYVIKSYIKNPKELIKAMYVWLECFYFVRVIKKGKINHIHSHWATMPTTAAMILNKLTGIPFSFTAHAWDIFVNCDRLEERIKKAKFVVTCTDYNREFLSYFCLDGEFKKVYLNYHGIDLNRFQMHQRPGVPALQSQNRACIILAIGRLVETKGFEYLIDACSILRDRRIEFECNIVGEGPLLKSQKLKVKRQKLEEKVKFLGTKTQEETKELYKETAILVQPSVMAKNGDRDGIPNVILEAMAVGLPVISTNFSGIPEVVIDRKTGILVPEKDSSALADVIESLWRNVSLRESLVLNSRKLIEEKFDVDKNTEELINIFKQNEVLI